MMKSKEIEWKINFSEESTSEAMGIPLWQCVCSLSTTDLILSDYS
jgi:hypothetical protein